MKKIWIEMNGSKRERMFFLWLSVSLLMITFPACEKDKTDYTKTNQIVQEIMYFGYYWNNKVDSKLLKDAPADIKPDEYFNSLLYDSTMVNPRTTREFDRWSFMVPYSEFKSVLVDGEYKSFGYFLALTPDRSSIRVCFTYAGSPMANAGIERGYELKRIGGKELIRMSNKEINEELAKETNRFVFADRQGNVLSEKTISASALKINPILSQKTYTVDGKKVGYIVYNTFITTSKNDIVAALQEFNDVDEFVLDLRYNGGGDVSVADAICEHLLPASAGTDSVDFTKYAYSERTNTVGFSGLKDEVHKIKRNAKAMDISRLFVIVSDMTASASEEVINGMKPFVDEVILVGTKTEGKPVGMLVWPDKSNNPQWAIAPITFRIDNKNGEGSYFAGISPTYKVEDDLYHDFGVDPQTLQGEENLQTIMEYIQTGSVPASISTKSAQKTTRIIQLRGLQIHAGCI